jgi:hypothetical protein
METIMRKLGNSILGALVLAALASTTAQADDGVRVDAAFTVSFMYPSAVDYCAPSGGDMSIEARGIGRVPGLGPMFLTVTKCVKFADATYAGTFSMSDGSGGTLNGTYAGTQSAGNPNGFGPFQGTLTVTGGTGRFRRARGALAFTAVAGPTSVGVTAPTANGTAYYLIRGELSRDRH